MCSRCWRLTTALGYSGHPQICYPDGKILDSRKTDRIINRDFYGAQNNWPICPTCKKPLPMFAPDPPTPTGPGKLRRRIAAAIDALALLALLVLALVYLL